MNKALLKEYLIVLPDNQNRICSGNYRCAYSLNSTEYEYGFVEDFDCQDYGVGCWLVETIWNRSLFEDNRPINDEESAILSYAKDVQQVLLL